jgi:hypothetical protein
MPSKQFLSDRRRGEKGQRIVAYVFRQNGFDVREVPRGMFRGYDLYVTGKGMTFTVEVKTDFKSLETGNLCVEVSSLTNSTAGLLAIVSGKTIYLADLKQALTLAGNYPIRSMGERNWARSALIPKHEFIEALNPKLLTTKA